MKILSFGAVHAPRLVPGELVNTFRVGTKWAGLKPGEVIALVDTESNEPLGLALVKSTRVGAWDEVRGHAGDNQTWRGSQDPEGSLWAELKEVYGSVEGPITVIYFTPAQPTAEVLALTRLAQAQQ